MKGWCSAGQLLLSSTVGPVVLEISLRLQTETLFKGLSLVLDSEAFLLGLVSDLMGLGFF